MHVESMGSMSGVFYYSLPFEMASLAGPGAYQFSWAGKRTHSRTLPVCVSPAQALQAHSPCTQLLHGSWGLRLNSHAFVVGILEAEPQIGSIFICLFQSFFPSFFSKD